MARYLIIDVAYYVECRLCDDRLTMDSEGTLIDTTGGDVCGKGSADALHGGGYGFLWVRATRRTGKVKESWRGYAMELPPSFRKVIEWTGMVHPTAWERG